MIIELMKNTQKTNGNLGAEIKLEYKYVKLAQDEFTAEIVYVRQNFPIEIGYV